MRSTFRPGRLACQRLALHVGCRVGGGQVHAVAALHQAHSQRSGQGGFAHAAFAHDHDESAPRLAASSSVRADPVWFGLGDSGRKFQAFLALLRCIHLNCLLHLASALKAGKSHGIEGAQGHLVARQVAASASGRWAMASRPRRFDGIGRRVIWSGWLAWNTPLMARRWFAQAQQRAARQTVRAASCMGRGSGRVTSTTVVSAGLLSAASAALKRALLHLQARVGAQARRPPVVVGQEIRVHALGRLSRRSVWPVGAVSNTTWSKLWSASAPSPASRAANSSNAAISVVQAPESCSRTVARSSSVAVASSWPARAGGRPRRRCRGRC